MRVRVRVLSIAGEGEGEGEGEGLIAYGMVFRVHLTHVDGAFIVGRKTD